MKTIGLSILMLLCSCTLFAQTDKDKDKDIVDAVSPISFGVKAGINISKHTLDVKGTDEIGADLGTANNLVNIYIGGLIHINLPKKFYLQPELVFSSEGFRKPDPDGSGKLTANLLYINMPVMIGYTLFKGLNVEVGPQLGVLLGANRSGIDIKHFYTKTDLALNGGLVYRFPFGLFVSGRYSQGLTDIDKEEFPGAKETNRVWSFGLGYLF